MNAKQKSEKQGFNNKSRKKIALGRGLGALFPDIGSIDTQADDYFQCDIDLIRPNRYQPRIKFSKDELEALCDSIKAQGILQPLLVRKEETGYELITGERRLRAAKMAKLGKVPAVLKDISDIEMLEIAIVENVQRENLNPIEEAEAYQRLIEEFNFTQDQVANRIGKSRPAVANFLRLRQLPDQIKDSISEGDLSMGHARAILGVESSAQQHMAWRAVVSKGMSVRQTEALIKRINSKKKKPKRPSLSSEDIYFKSLEESLSRQFGTKVIINRKGQKGKVEIEFYNNDDLDRVIQQLQK